MEVLWECKRNPVLRAVVEVELPLLEKERGQVGWARVVAVCWQAKSVSGSVAKEVGWWL